MRTALLYALFAAVATLVNLSAQFAATQAYSGPWSISLSVVAGTIAGIIVKYVLDKSFIFMPEHSGAIQHVRSFTLYVIASVLTTAIFWGTEALFQFTFDSAPMRYFGGAIGLCIGYMLKFQLDKRFAFAPSSR